MSAGELDQSLVAKPGLWQWLVANGAWKIVALVVVLLVASAIAVHMVKLTYITDGRTDELLLEDVDADEATINLACAASLWTAFAVSAALLLVAWTVVFVFRPASGNALTNDDTTCAFVISSKVKAIQDKLKKVMLPACEGDECITINGDKRVPKESTVAMVNLLIHSSNLHHSILVKSPDSADLINDLRAVVVDRQVLTEYVPNASEHEKYMAALREIGNELNALSNKQEDEREKERKEKRKKEKEEMEKELKRRAEELKIKNEEKREARKRKREAEMRKRDKEKEEMVNVDDKGKEKEEMANVDDKGKEKEEK